MVPLGLACRASLAGHLDADEIFAITRQGLDFYTGLFQGDFPFAKYDQVFVPDYSVALPRTSAASSSRTNCCPGPGSPARCTSCGRW
jgi:aminopeptidase N